MYEKPQKYNELQYLLHLIKLGMEFYIKILELFYKPRNFMFELFAGTKLLVASIVSVASAHSIAGLKLNSLLM